MLVNHSSKLLVVLLTAATLGLSILAAFGLVLADAPNRLASDVGSSPDEIPPVSAFQSRILSDGLVADDEMRDAVDRTVKCIEAQGLRATVPDEALPGVDRVILVVTDDAAPSSIVRECKAEYMGEVDRAYARQLAGPPPDLREVEQSIRDCLASRGFPVPELTADALTQVHDSGPSGARAIQDCFGAVGAGR